MTLSAGTSRSTDTVSRQILAADSLNRIMKETEDLQKIQSFPEGSRRLPKEFLMSLTLFYTRGLGIVVV